MVFTPLPRSVSKPLLDPRDSLSLFANDYAARTSVSVAVDPVSFGSALRSVVEAIASVPVIEKPGEKGDGIFVERTLLDALLPFNATISAALAFVTASANELTRTNKINDLVNYLVEEEESSGSKPEPSLPWEWDRVGHDTCGNFAKDCGAQTLTRLLERSTKKNVGSGTSYCELLKHAHKAACKEYHDCRAVAGTRAIVAAKQSAKVVLLSPTFYVVRATTSWFADVAVDAVAYFRGQLSGKQLFANSWLKAVKYSLGGFLCLAFGGLVPFLYPHPYVFIGVEQLAANLIADTVVESYLGHVEPS